ncbi:MAG TPA: VTT domain-containing protein [Acidobacteriaceae bacterium]|nr:VTT domain-containing protein [Acidobacteriaceae bacterium]
MKLHPIALLHKAAAILMATFKPLGIWGLGALAFIDSGLFPLPTTMDGVVIGYVASDHRKFLWYCLMAAFTSAIGSLIPYYVGRAGGELFLLKRINRKRYEDLRDRFENQEFLAIMFPAMMPPPMPIKLFEFAAGVFEMKPVLFATAIFVGKFIQFLVCAIITIYYGPKIADTWRHAVRDHFNIVMALVSAAGLIFVVYLIRKIMGVRRGSRRTDEDDGEDSTTP